MMKSEEILDAAETSSYLKLHVKTVRRMAANGHLPAFKVGSEWRFRRSDLDSGTKDEQSESKKLNVLVVDDHEIVRETIKEFFRTVGFVVITAPNGKEALVLMDSFAPDVVVLDLQMPVMDGPETLKHIRERFGSIPVVILTGFADTGLMERALEWSPFTVVRKPMEPEELVGAVKAAAVTKTR